jgi:hypothetical protein
LALGAVHDAIVQGVARCLDRVEVEVKQQSGIDADELARLGVVQWTNEVEHA